MRGFQKLVSQTPGFDPQPLLTLQADVPPDRYPDAAAVERFLLPALEAVRSVPGVADAAALSLIPYTNWGWNFNIRYEGRDAPDPTRLPLVETRTATPSLFNTLQMRLLRGRLLEETDNAGAPTVVVANQALAERDFPGEDPIGKRFFTGDTTFATIVGVVANIKNQAPEIQPAAEVYWSYAQTSRGSTSFPLIVRVNGDPAKYVRAVSDAVRRVEPMAAVSQVRPMREVMAQSVARARFFLTLLNGFAIVALLLAIAGLYGVMNYSVVQRTREIGIRAALGSSPGATLRRVMRQGFALVLLGIVAGLTGGYGLTRLLDSMLYGISPLDAVTWVLVILLMAAAAAFAMAMPARRAAGTSPMTAMRAE
jgi:predicted permease